MLEQAVRRELVMSIPTIHGWLQDVYSVKNS